MARGATTLSFLLALLAPSAGPMAADLYPPMTLYKHPQCSCCEGHAQHLRERGFTVEVIATGDLAGLKEKHSVPEALEGCHTIVIGGYVVEGHVPADAIKRVLKERPPVAGISLPGMPEGSPGMSGQKAEPFTIYSFDAEGEIELYAVE